MSNRAITEWLAERAPAASGSRASAPGRSYCTPAGLLTGRRATTHWASIERFRQLGGMTVLRPVRYVRDGNVVTSAGVWAGIDMSLWVVGQLWGIEHARFVQRAMEYEPAPPYAAEVDAAPAAIVRRLRSFSGI